MSPEFWLDVADLGLCAASVCLLLAMIRFALASKEDDNDD